MRVVYSVKRADRLFRIARTDDDDGWCVYRCDVLLWEAFLRGPYRTIRAAYAALRAAVPARP